MLRFRVPGRGRQRPWNGLPVQAGCCPVSPRRYRSACHASQARSICAGVELASARCGRTCRSPGPARPAAGAQHDGRAARPRSGVPRPGGPGPGLRRRWRCGPARRRPGPGRRPRERSRANHRRAGASAGGWPEYARKGPRTEFGYYAPRLEHMRAAASGPVQAVCRCGKGCGDTCLNMPVGKIYPEDFAGRANRDDHAGRRPSISSARSTSSTGWGRSVQPLALAMILVKPLIVPV